MRTGTGMEVQWRSKPLVTELSSIQFWCECLTRLFSNKYRLNYALQQTHPEIFFCFKREHLNHHRLIFIFYNVYKVTKRLKYNRNNSKASFTWKIHKYFPVNYLPFFFYFSYRKEKICPSIKSYFPQHSFSSTLFSLAEIFSGQILTLGNIWRDNDKKNCPHFPQPEKKILKQYIVAEMGQSEVKRKKERFLRATQKKKIPNRNALQGKIGDKMNSFEVLVEVKEREVQTEMKRRIRGERGLASKRTLVIWNLSKGQVIAASLGRT